MGDGALEQDLEFCARRFKFKDYDASHCISMLKLNMPALIVYFKFSNFPLRYQTSVNTFIDHKLITVNCSSFNSVLSMVSEV